MITTGHPNGSEAFSTSACYTSWPTATYGYSIAARLTDAGFADVKGSTLYPLLKRLEGAGLVDIEWRPGEAGPGRKFYLINTAGRQRLMALTASWQRYSTTVTRLLDEGSLS